MLRYLLAGLMLAALSGCGTRATEWVAGWQPMTAMTTARAGAAVIQVNGVIYAIGGVNGEDFMRSAEYSRIDSDGRLDPWQLSSPLKEQRGFFAVAYNKGYVYVVGGGNGPSGHHLLRTVERAAVLPSGDLGPWEEELNQLVYPRRCAKLVVVGNDLYAIGGFSGVLQDTVERARIQPDGHLGPWALLDNKLTMPRYIHVVKKNRKGIYVIGGHSEVGGTGQTAVEWRPLLDPNGDVPWRRTAAMHTGRYALEAAAHDDFLYAMGGLNGARYLNSIEKAQLAPDGSLQPWTQTTPLSSTLANFGTVVYKDWIYVVGGTTSGGTYYKTVERATFNDKGDIGFWATPEQAKSYRQRAEAAAKSSLPMPNAGVVVDLIQTKAYSYVKVRGDDGTRWLAGPRTDLKTGDAVRYSRGMEMDDFFSRQLQRKFDSILFVEGVERVN